MDRLFKFFVSFLLLAFLAAVMYVLATLIQSAFGTGTIRALVVGAVIMAALMILVLMYIFSLVQEWRFETVMTEAKELFNKSDFAKAKEACLRAENILSDDEASLQVLKFLEEIYEKTEDKSNLKDVKEKIRSLQEEPETT